MPRKTRPVPAAARPSPRASMRPRPDAAENAVASRSPRITVTGFNEAAARCRGKPPLPVRRGDGRRRGFNEAAARCRGKHTYGTPDSAFVTLASMRPRPDAAENARIGGGPKSGRSSFNEAAARCRGKRSSSRGRTPTAGRRFNEAAARCRGKQENTLGELPGIFGFNEAAARCRGKL